MGIPTTPPVVVNGRIVVASQGMAGTPRGGGSGFGLGLLLGLLLGR